MNKRYLESRYLVSFLMCFVVSALWAQGDDFTTWTTMKVNYKFAPAFIATGGVELRTMDSMKSIDRWGASLGLSYNALSFLKLDGGYEVHYRNRGVDGWKIRHRYYLGATGSYQWKQLKVSLRERIQQTINQGNAENRLRSRLKLGYAPIKGIVSPYFSFEIYQSLDDAPLFGITRTRYRPGVELALAPKWVMDVFYCYQHEPDKSKHVVGIECAYTF